jgi:hypothetical protein
MDPEFIHASKLLANELDIAIDDSVTGDIEVLQAFLTGETIDVIAGTDVIEHIYNLNNFFSIMQAMNAEMISVFTTASNPDNFIKIRALKKLQIKDEWEGSEPEDFVLAGAEKHAAFMLIRENIITQNFPFLEKESLQQLTKNSRGLNKTDLIAAVQHFLKSGQMPIPDAHSTNTCNPITGSWTERILTIGQYKDIYSSHGFILNIRNGFYDAQSSGIKKSINRILNQITKIIGRNMAPFITLIGYKSSKIL